MPSSSKRVAKAPLVVLVLASTLVLGPGVARADGSRWDTVAHVGTVSWGIAQVGFLAADLYHGTRNEWLPRYATWTQATLMSSGSVAAGVLTLRYENRGVWLAIAVTDFVLAGWFFVHGLLGIMNLESVRDEDEGAPAPAARSRGLSLRVSAWPGGVGASLVL
ncbi:MAG: hypothetical protein NZ898_09290 [Myxococcota bacterium]|nr:hypothetical protein [Myxococcota bacterium]MDW8361629.1 hypothetical protein [Myxococcales bacterium]